MRFFLTGLLLASFGSAIAQNGEIKGVVKDAISGELLPGVSVIAVQDKGAITDIDGNYSIKVEDGEYTVSVSYVGYLTQTAKAKVNGNAVAINFRLEASTLNEVEIVSDVAKTRETPVAFTNIPETKLKEELASRDLTVLLNSTPGAYATEQGGGSGDSRVNIRGFNQRNVAVMVDGVPVNDMENGWVYWSNWDGIGDVTRTVQVQRGLGASRLAIPSVGGTINILTRGIESQQSLSVKQEYGNNLMLKTSLSYNSGMLKHGWGITFAGTRKTGNGWVDQTWTDAWSYFFKVQKRFEKHLLSLSVNGAPQKHGQRSNRLPIAVYDKALAKKIIDKDYADSTEDVRNKLLNTSLISGNYTTLTQGSHGLKYNPHWGNLDRGNGKKALNERMNYFHKPVINLSDFWTVNDKLYVSNIAYLSMGSGGGTALATSIGRDSLTGELNYQPYYQANTQQIDALYSTTEHKSSNIIRSSINNHIWYGLLSAATWKADTALTFTFGVDGRYYKGIHYREVYDLLGGDYYINTSNKNQPSGMGNLQHSIKREGDKITYYNDAYVYWGGLFSQAEFKKNRWSIFATISVSETGYQRKDYFLKKDLVLPDTTFFQAMGYADTIQYNGQTYTSSSPEAKHTTTNKKWFLGYTLKGGANYNINTHTNIFMNVGYITMAPRFNNVFDNSGKEFLEIKNQLINAVELGYGKKYPKWAANVNLYYTRWENKPPDFAPTINIAGDIFSYNVNGMLAIHKGIEMDGTYKISNKLEGTALVSIGDWIYNSAKKAYITDQDDVIVDSLEFSAKGVHVGDAAQIQYSTGLRYEAVKNLYFKGNFTWFGKNFSNFDPLTLTPENANRESWKMPNYSLVDFHAGYEFKYWNLRFNLSANLINVFDMKYITDAQNGYDFNAATSLVYLGQGRRFTTSLKITF